MIVAAILVAAGSGERLGYGLPKALVDIDGRTLLELALEPFTGHPRVRDLVVVGPPDRLDDVIGLAAGARVVAGGRTRQESVSAGLAELSADVDLVLVHDVARPFMPAAVIDRVLDELLLGADAVIPVRPVTDTIKQVAGDVVVATVDRADLRAVQTPQGFPRAVLAAAHAGSDVAVTDDAALIEAGGGRVVVVDGSDESFKITHPWDLSVAHALMAWRERSGR